MSKPLEGKTGVVFGVANKNSIAWGIAKAWHEAGARLAFTYQGERLKGKVEKLVADFGGDTLITECDVSSDEDIDPEEDAPITIEIKDKPVVAEISILPERVISPALAGTNAKTVNTVDNNIFLNVFIVFSFCYVFI